MCADDVLISRFGQFEHLAGQKPAFAHLVAVAVDAFAEFLDMAVAGRDLEVAVVFYGVAEEILDLRAVIEELFADELFEMMTAIELAVVDAVVDLEEDEVEHSGKSSRLLLPRAAYLT